MGIAVYPAVYQRKSSIYITILSKGIRHITCPALTSIAFCSIEGRGQEKTGRRAWLPLYLQSRRVPLRHFTMTRKDSEKDSERTHYYSQFWLDVAAGKRIIGAPKPEDEVAEFEVLEATLPLRKSARSASYDDGDDSQFDGRTGERIVHPVAEPLVTPEEFIETEPEEIDLEADTLDTPDFPEEVVDDLDIPDMDLEPVEEEKDEDDEASEEVDEDVVAEEGAGESEDEEEDEEDIGWGGRGRKRNKPVRPKAPPKKLHVANHVAVISNGFFVRDALNRTSTKMTNKDTPTDKCPASASPPQHVRSPAH